MTGESPTRDPSKNTCPTAMECAASKREKYTSVILLMVKLRLLKATIFSTMGHIMKDNSKILPSMVMELCFMTTKQ